MVAFEKMSVKELEAEVQRHNALYFQKHQPEISDAEFDRLVEILRQKHPRSAVLHEISSDASVGGKVVRHTVPMLSLDKCYEEKEITRWGEKFEGEVLATPKIDGVAVALRYNAGGDLALGATRGNGLEGEVITANVQYIRDIPQKTNLKNAEVRGEIFMPLSVFEDFREAFANPRNLAAGAIKQKDPRKTGEYRLSFFAYDLLGANVESEEAKRVLLRKNGFTIVEGKSVPKDGMQKIFEDFFEKRLAHDYETDGVVFKVNRVPEQKRLGATAHHPRYAMAYKFQGDYGETVLREILWSVSRTGAITPVGVVDPVNLSGANVTRVSLHNFGLTKKMGVTLPSKVLMVRSGGVIPKVEKVLEGKGKPLAPPKYCPSCGSSVELRDDFLFCTNPKKCSVSRVGELDHFVKVIGIDGFGKKHLRQLYEKGLVADPAGFFSLKKEDLATLERMGEKLAEKLVANIQARKKLPLDIFLRSLGIHELGKHVSKIMSGFGSLKEVFKVSAEELAEIHTIGEKIARFVTQGLKEKRDLIDHLLKYVEVLPGRVISEKGGLFEGKSFLFTGTLRAMKRSEAEAEVEKRGGEAAGGVSKNLTYLVIGEAGGAGSKLEKVKKLQRQGATTRILKEKEFLHMLTKR